MTGVDVIYVLSVFDLFYLLPGGLLYNRCVFSFLLSVLPVTFFAASGQLISPRGIIIKVSSKGIYM